jgi:hypothetical protein
LNATNPPAPTPAVKENAQLGIFFTATIVLAAHGNGTKYTAAVIHADAWCKQHTAMGFHKGQGKALDQLVAYPGKM